MCGIVGYTNTKVTMDHERIVKAMTDLVTHRGPNDYGQYIDEKSGTVLGFRRLTIIDFSKEANQPFYNHDGTLVQVFNGEIYNYQELRAELQEKGHTFISETDSEVVLRGYEAWGKDVLTRLRGMFAFAIWDAKTESLLLARDFFGIKPMYFTENTLDGSFLFGSEIKSFLAYPQFKKELNPKALRPYLTLQYSATEETFFKGVYKLPPATCLRYQNGSWEMEKFWDYDYDATDEPLEVYVKRIQEVMRDSVDYHLRADVKVGSFLSGGIDSSYIAALSKPDDTFTVGFKDYEGMFNETELGSRLSDILGFRRHSRLLTSDECFDVLPTIQYQLDEPQANLSTIPLYFLAELASQHVTVVLSGEGADELFGGYDAYRDTKLMTQFKRLPLSLRKGIAKVFRRVPSAHLRDAFHRGSQTVEESYLGEAYIFKDKEAMRLLKEPYQVGPNAFDLAGEVYATVADKDDLTKKQVIDIAMWMPGDILLKADKMSSAHSLELRVPFLDKEVMKVAETLPAKYRVNGLTTKYALRTAALAELPEEWAKRPKVGFAVPMKDWLREEKHHQYVKEVFSRDYVKKFFDQERLMAYLDAHYQGKGMYQRKIYTVLAFLIWYDEYFVKR